MFSLPILSQFKLVPVLGIEDTFEIKLVMFGG